MGGVPRSSTRCSARAWLCRAAKCAARCLSNRVFVDERAEVEDSILFRGTVVGKGAKVRRAIVDKWIKIPEGCEIGHDLDADRERFKVTESGIVVVPRGYEF